MVALAGLVHLAIAICFAVHAIRSGQPIYWLFVLLAFPLLGSVVYFLAIYLPGMRYTRGGIRAARAVSGLVDPNRELRAAEIELDRTPTAYNRARLASALLGKGRAAEAVDLYRQAASGPYANDAAFLEGLSRAELAAGRPGDAVSTLERLFAAHDDRRRGASALAYAEALAGAGRDDARGAFEAVIATEPTTEARCKYGRFLLSRGDVSGARRAFESVLSDADRGHAHSRDLNREWIDDARAQLKRMADAAT